MKLALVLIGGQILFTCLGYFWLFPLCLAIALLPELKNWLD